MATHEQDSAATSKQTAALEAKIQRNPHREDFSLVQARRPDWEDSPHTAWKFTKPRNPEWKFGDGAAQETRIDPESANGGQHKGMPATIEIDPHEAGRPSAFNYKLLISGWAPRPIGLLSTQSKDGSSQNLAPFSYTQMVNHDPPIFVVGFSSGIANAKDSLRNLLETGECVINVISEHFLEAANSTSINAPYGISEWDISGLTQAPCSTVRPSRVQESIFAVEGRLMNTQEFDSRENPGAKSGTLAVIEGTRFWVREDAVNKEKNLVDPAILKPITRLGGITYGRTTTGIELIRPSWDATAAEFLKSRPE